jgi:DNA-binding response OmpR family regulator
MPHPPSVLIVDDSEDTREVHAAGADQFLTKPCRPEDLEAAIRNRGALTRTGRRSRRT